MGIWKCNGCEKHHMIQSEKCPGYCFMTGRAIRNDCREVNGKNPQTQKQKPEPRGWIEIGAIVYVRKEKRYGMIIGFDSISGDPIIGFRTGGAPYLMSEISQARKRLWNDEEMKKKVGKVFEDMNGELHLCLGFKIHKEICGEPKKYGVLYMAGCGPITHSSECLFNDGWKLEGNQCGELEYFDANREEWLK